MIISRKYALRLIKSGKAKTRGVVDSDGRQYVVLDRLDLWRTDHYPARSEESA